MAARLIADELSRVQVETLERNCEEFGVPVYSLGSDHQGIVHVIGPELGITQPGLIICCGDSHTSTHGALGALAFGMGASEVLHVLATQTVWQRKPKSMRINYTGELGFGVTPKDLILGTIGQMGTGGAAGHVVEYAGPVIERDGDYFGPPVNRVARLLSAGHGGQVLKGIYRRPEAPERCEVARDLLLHRRGNLQARVRMLVQFDAMTEHRALPLGTMGRRLQVHPASVTNPVHRRRARTSRRAR
jgi:hypothetical protein